VGREGEETRLAAPARRLPLDAPVASARRDRDARERSQAVVWAGRIVALAALLGFWSGLLVLAGLPRWTLAVPGGLLALLVLAAVLPLLAWLAMALGRGTLAAATHGARGGAFGLGMASRFLVWALRGSVSLGGRAASATSVLVPRAARATLTGGRRAGNAVYGAGASGARLVRAAAVADDVRRRRHAAQLTLTASRLLRLGRAEDAAARCEHALDVLRRVEDPRMEAAALETLALADVHRGDEERALERYERVHALLRELGDADGEARVLSAVAALHDWRAVSEEPVRRWREGLEALERRRRRKRKAPARKRSSR
jgi:hypothetical protein